MNKSDESFSTPDGFMAKLSEAITGKKVSKILVSFEIHFPAKFFCQPFELPQFYLSNAECCEEYPENKTDDYRFEFLKKR